MLPRHAGCEAVNRNWNEPGQDRGGDARAAKPAVVKKYANRRLYNTATSSYVTLTSSSQMVREGEEFVVFDAKTGEDITRSVLTQIILEEDSKGRNLLPIGFLRHLIGFYDDSLQCLPAALSRAEHGELRAPPGPDAQLCASRPSAASSR